MTSSIPAVAWSPDGSYIASGSDDYKVQVWNAVDGSNVFTKPPREAPAFMHGEGSGVPYLGLGMGIP